MNEDRIFMMNRICWLLFAAVIATSSTRGTSEEEEKVEYIFKNDQFSNGIWDVEGKGQEGSDATEDDDAEEIKFGNGLSELESGEVWLTHDAISDISFYSPQENSGRSGRECHPDDKLDFSGGGKFVISETKKFPRGPVFMRVDGNSIEFDKENPQIEDDLVLTVKVGQQKSEIAKLRLVVVEGLGAKNYFHAARDYILENDSRLYKDRMITASNEGFHIVCLRSESTRMTALQTYYRSPQLKGLPAVVAAYPEQTLIINGNYVDFEPKVNVLRLKGKLANVCYGNLVSSGVVDARISRANNAYGGPHAKFIGQLPDNDGKPGDFVIDRGQPNDSDSTRTPTPNSRKRFTEALGGLSTNYLEHNKNHTNSFGKVKVGDNEVIFTITSDIKFHPTGGGTGLLEMVNKAAKSGVAKLKTDLSSDPTRYELVVFDAGSSVAMAYETPNNALTSVVLGNKHAVPPRWDTYYVPTYLMFKSTKPSEEQEQ